MSPSPAGLAVVHSAARKSAGRAARGVASGSAAGLVGVVVPGADVVVAGPVVVGVPASACAPPPSRVSRTAPTTTRTATTAAAATINGTRFRFPPPPGAGATLGGYGPGGPWPGCTGPVGGPKGSCPPGSDRGW